MSETPRAPAIPQTTPGLPSGVVSRVERPGRPRWQVATLGLSIGAAVPLLLAFIAAYLGGYSYQSLSSVGPPADLRLQPKQGVPQLEKRLAGSAPKGFYVVVDTAGNRLYLRKGEETVREAVCSTGTGGVLTDPKSGKQWVFETPFGLRKIQTKVKNPVWVKPEWAFVEEGKSMKDAPASERFDKAALGDYAMDIGNGYKIHGTLYTRMLGKSVTHGCIRLGDEDLLAVYNAVQVGTPVYLY